MKKIGIIAAMSKEISLVKSLMSDLKEVKINGIQLWEGHFDNHEIILVQCGIGKVCAAIGATELINRYHPDYIINTGAAGGIASGLDVMNIVVADQTAYYDVFCGEELGQLQGFPRYFAMNEILLSKAADLGLKTGLIASGDKFITSLAEVQHIQSIYPEALAVDMESAAIAQVCHLHQTPFLSIRVISDTPGVENHLEQYENFWVKAGEESFNFIHKLLKSL